MRRSLLLSVVLLGCGRSGDAPETKPIDAAAFLAQVEAAAPVDRAGLLRTHPDERNALRADPALRTRLDRAMGRR